MSDPGKQSEAEHSKRLSVLLLIVAALGLVAGSAATIAGQLEVHSPIERWIQVAGFVIAGISTLASGLVARFGKKPMIAGVVFWVIIAGSAVLVVVTGALIFTHDPIDLKPGERLAGKIGSDSSRVHRFEAELADTVFLRVRSLTTGLDLSAIIEKGRVATPLGQAPDDSWEAETTLGKGGVWDLLIISGELEGRYEVRLEVEPGKELELDQPLPREQLVRKGDSNGYVFVAPALEAVLVIVDELTGGLDLDIRILREGARVSAPRPAQEGRHEIPVGVEQDSDSYVVVIASPSGKTGQYALEVQSDLIAMPPISTTSSVPPLSTTSTGLTTTTTVAVPPTLLPPDETVALPDLYNVADLTAERELIDLGLTVGIVPVCSSSVSEGRVRQVFLLADDRGEIVAVDQDGVLPPGEAVSSDQTVFLKISTGEACD